MGPEVCETNLTSRMDPAENIIMVLITTYLVTNYYWDMSSNDFLKKFVISQPYQPGSPSGLDGI